LWLLANFFSLIETIVGLQISRRPGSPESLQQLIETARSNANNVPGFAFAKDEKVIQSKDKKVRQHLRMI
jgi:CCR4-NOT transcription complex subunit 1